MKTNFIKTLGVNVSALGMGCMRFPTSADGKIDYHKSIEMIELCYESGINYFDTAYVYHNGESETFIGKALEKYPRENFYVADKLPCWDCHNPKDIERIFNEQLERLNMDYIDFYLLHALNKDSFEKMMNLGAYEFLERKKSEGKIKYAGFSFHDSAENLKIITEKHKWDFAMSQINYLDWIRGEASSIYKILRDKNIPSMVMEPVRGGALAKLNSDAEKILKSARPSDSVASWALRFAASLDNVPVVLSGMSSIEQVRDNVKTVKNFDKLSDSEFELLKKALEIHGYGSVPCTDCKYCIPCPAGVDIPKVFFEYNHHKTWADIGRLRHETNELNKKNALPSACTKCMACTERCPQKIAIPDELVKVGAYIEDMLK